jgi:hypothetical protein
MNTSDLSKRYPKGIPEKLTKYIAQFESLKKEKGIISIRLMANFGKDIEQSLRYKTDIFRGLVVETTSDYVLGERDRMWFHPQVYTTRKFAKTSEYESDVSEFNANVGLYSAHEFDDIGGHSKTSYVIADDYAQDVTSKCVDRWMTASMQMKDIYNDMHFGKIDGENLQAHSRNKVNTLVTAKGEEHVYNVLYKGNSSYMFYNYTIKPDKLALVHISPLMGYAHIPTREFAVAADLMSSEEFMDIKEFTEQQRKRAYVDCDWKGKNIVNTFIMRKPIDNYKAFLTQPTRYMMEKGHFSANPIVDQLPPHLILFLTPNMANVPPQRLSRLHTHIKQDVFKITASESLISDLFSNHWKKLISKKYLQDDNLVLPRELVTDFFGE